MRRSFHSFIQLATHTCGHALIYPRIPPTIHLSSQSSIEPSIQLAILSTINPSIHPFIHPTTNPSIHSLIQPLLCRKSEKTAPDPSLGTTCPRAYETVWLQSISRFTRPPIASPHKKEKIKYAGGGELNRETKGRFFWLEVVSWRCF